MTVFHKGNKRASKLSESEVLEIRRRYARERVTQGQLSREFGVGVIQIGRIVRGEVWQHLEAPDVAMSEGELKDSADRMLRLSEAQGLERLSEEVRERGEGDRMIAELSDLPKGPLDE